TLKSALPSRLGTNWMHALTARKRTSSPASSPTTTVQAPQSPSAHPSLVPLRRRSSRRKLRTDFDGLTPSTSTSSPPRRKRTVERSLSVMRHPKCQHSDARTRQISLSTLLRNFCGQFLSPRVAFLGDGVACAPRHAL